ncbi:YbbR-like domain-containing protein [Nonlabens ponticola]|uniref:YbbR-like domain-containing protein n=1 Tax=Nonlabens ponticola TaxID=2496866 RepID=A0A3S9MY15_9FLAO|nr:hypothetical protein [Nonlabens ponticola]AZQ44022.1 hypothetical protein EJ995_07175 [Nonlabens ponticola]
MSYKKFFVFFVFILAAALMWFLSRYNSQYREQVVIKTSFVSVPNQVNLDVQDRSIDVMTTIESSGFRLLWMNYQSLESQLEFDEVVSLNDGEYIFDPQRALSSYDEQLGEPFKVVSIDTDPITLSYSRFKSKTIMLEKDFDVTFTGSYQQLGDGFFNQEQVEVTGNDERLDSLQRLKVTMLDVVVKDTMTIKTIELDSLYPDFKFEPSAVTYSIRAAQMTEGNLRIPVTVINKPSNVLVRLIPENVNLVFTARLDQFETVTENDFKVTIDYRKLDNADTSAIPDIEILTDAVLEARTQPAAIQVLSIE